MSCDWCQGGACDLVYNTQDHSVRGEIDEDTGVMTFFYGEDIVGSRKVNYCPMCGRQVGSADNLPPWTVCFRCIHRGERLFCDKCNRNSFAPCGMDKKDNFESRS